MGAAVDTTLGAADTVLFGRKTYDSFAGAWPEREAAGGEDAGLAKALGDARKIVVSAIGSCGWLKVKHRHSWRFAQELELVHSRRRRIAWQREGAKHLECRQTEALLRRYRRRRCDVWPRSSWQQWRR
jgi:dihydrofolate reductase